MNRSPARKKWRRKLLVACAAFGVIVLSVGGYAGYLYVKADSAIHRMAAPPQPSPSASASASAPAGIGGIDSPASEAENDAQKPITFLLAGIDNRAGSGGTLNTDVLILAVLNPATKSASLLSLPRDLELKPASMNAHKANYFYAYFYNKDKDTAIANTKQFYSDLFQFPIDHMVIINFDGLRKLVDAVGGLTIDVDMDMKYRDTADGTDIDLKKGLQKLDGKQALDFVRYRKSNEGTQQSSDIARNRRQQQVLTQIADKLASFHGMTQWGNVLDIVGDNVRTDIAEDDLRSWILHYGDMLPNTTKLVSFDTRWESPYIVVDEDDFRQALDALREEAKLPPNENLKLADVVGIDEQAKDSSSLQ